jgi:hypothetical protein
MPNEILVFAVRPFSLRTTTTTRTRRTNNCSSANASARHLVEGRYSVSNVPRSGDLLEHVMGVNRFYVATATFWDGSRGASRGSCAICVVRKKGRVLLKICGDAILDCSS